VFIDAMGRSNRPVFLLEDGKEMTHARRDLESRYALKRIATLDVPLFGASDLTTAVLWEIQP
jgi:hypothetical protein